MGKSKDANMPGRAEAARAVETLIRFAGDDPARAGMKDTAERVLKFYETFFTGYDFDAAAFKDSIAEGLSYDDFVIIRDIRLDSFCEHHMLPAYGTATIAYTPNALVPGLGAVTRLVSDAARRFTTQEDITKLIAQRMNDAFDIEDIAITVTLTHGCMTLRDKENAKTTVATTHFNGQFNTDMQMQNRYLLMTQEQGKADNAHLA